LFVAAFVATALLVPLSIYGQNAKEHFTGFAINMNGGPKSTATVDFTIERWSTDAERDQLLAILKEEKDTYKANQKLLKALQKMPKVGYIRTTNTLAWDLRYARQSPLEDGGRRVVLGTTARSVCRGAQPGTAPWTIRSRLSKYSSTRTTRGRQDPRGHEDLHRQEQQPRARELRPAAGAVQRDQEGQVA
jgi:hypothetical protein